MKDDVERELRELQEVIEEWEQTEVPKILATISPTALYLLR